jgi:hypothetical protein
MGFLDIFKGKPTPPNNENVNFEGFRAVNTDGLDLSKPFIDDYNVRSLRFIEFGEGNLYPQILNQLYVSSPMHQACCNFKKYALCGDGYEWVGYEELSVPEKIQIQQFEIMSGIKKGIGKIVLDWIKHGRVIALVRFDKETNKYTHFRLVDPEYIRNSRVDWFSDKPDAYYYSKDWATRRTEVCFKPVSPKNWDEWQVSELKNEVGGFRSYGMPDWAASANWQVVSADLGLLHKSAIENGIQPSIVWKFPYVMSPEERQRWEHQAQQNGKGAKNYGRAIKLEAPGKDLMPEIDVVNTTDNHKLFEQTSKEQKEEIAISHNLDPALMGVRVAGSLGNADERPFAASQFKRIWLNSNRKQVEDFLNEVAKLCGITCRLNIKETEITDAIQAVAGAAPTAPTENLSEAPKTNDALRGLTAKENMDMMRIARDYAKGKLAEPLARTRLAAYGIDTDTINEILAQ